MTDTNQAPKRASAPTNQTQEVRVYSHDEHQSGAEEGLCTDYKLRVGGCTVPPFTYSGGNRTDGGFVTPPRCGQKPPTWSQVFPGTPAAHCGDTDHPPARAGSFSSTYTPASTHPSSVWLPPGYVKGGTGFGSFDDEACGRDTLITHRCESPPPAPTRGTGGTRAGPSLRPPGSPAPQIRGGNRRLSGSGAATKASRDTKTDSD
eukprot:1192764-Prorocentrum_minimum.AAC.2